MTERKMYDAGIVLGSGIKEDGTAHEAIYTKVMDDLRTNCIKES